MDRWIGGFMGRGRCSTNCKLKIDRKTESDIRCVRMASRVPRLIGRMRGAALRGGKAAPNGSKRHQTAVNGTKNKDVLLIKTWRPRDCAGLSGALDCACPSGALASA